MTQASLSPDLHNPLGAQPSIRDEGTKSGVSHEAALWMTALMSSGLVVAALMLLGLLMRNVVTDASLGGFVAGIGIVIAVLGLGGVSYAMITARRAGYLSTPDGAKSPASAFAPAGMHVVPALPPDLGRRKRRQLEAERNDRNRQARAIAAAAAVSARRPSPVSPSRTLQRPALPPRPAPHAVAPGPNRAAPPRPARPMPPRPAPTRRVIMAPPARPPMPTRPAITMPRAQVRPLRPAAWPSRVPVVRMAAPPMHPRMQATMFQVNAANVRAARPVGRR